MLYLSTDYKYLEHTALKKCHCYNANNTYLTTWSKAVIGWFLGVIITAQDQLQTHFKLQNGSMQNKLWLLQFEIQFDNSLI